MKDISLNRRYAYALFQLATIGGNADRWFEQLHTLREIMSGMRQIQAVLMNRFTDLTKRKAIVDELAKKLALDHDVGSFVKVLIDRKRLDAFAGIVEQFEVLADRVAGRTQVEVRAAKSLDAKVLADLQALLADKLHKKPKLSLKLDERLIGGLQLAWSGRLLDGSVRGQLDNLRRVLM